MIEHSRAPLTVLYRCNLEDTALLVGLVQNRRRIGKIAYTGPIDEICLKYISSMNAWLENKGQVKISVHPHLSMQDLELLAPDLISEWRWGKSECETAIRLAELPLPNK